MYVENIDHIKSVWCKYTAETRGAKMHIKFLAQFLIDIGEPFGAKEDQNIWDIAKLASSYKIRV